MHVRTHRHAGFDWGIRPRTNVGCRSNRSKHLRLDVLDKHAEDLSLDGASTCVCHIYPSSYPCTYPCPCQIQDRDPPFTRIMCRLQSSFHKLITYTNGSCFSTMAFVSSTLGRVYTTYTWDGSTGAVRIAFHAVESIYYRSQSRGL